MAQRQPSVMLLGAGLGTRLRPLTDVLPKPAAPLLGRPLAGYSLERAAAAGCSHVVINAHHLSERLMVELSAWCAAQLPQLTVQFSVEMPDVLGTGGALVQARPLLAAGAADGPVLIINGDILCDFDLPQLLDAHRRSSAAATLLLIDHPEVERFGAVTMDDDGRVVDLAGHGSRSDDATGGPAGPVTARGVFSGVHLVEPAVYAHLPPRGFSCVVRQGYGPMMAAGEDLRGVIHGGSWNDLGTLDRYLDTHEQLLQAGPIEDEGTAWSVAPDGRHHGDGDAVTIHPDATVIPPVAMGAGAQIQRGATVGPAVYLGAGATVGARARIERSVLWPGAQVQPDTKHARVIAFRDGKKQRTCG